MRRIRKTCSAIDKNIQQLLTIVVVSCVELPKSQPVSCNFRCLPFGVHRWSCTQWTAWKKKWRFRGLPLGAEQRCGTKCRLFMFFLHVWSTNLVKLWLSTSDQMEQQGIQESHSYPWVFHARTLFRAHVSALVSPPLAASSNNSCKAASWVRGFRGLLLFSQPNSSCSSGVMPSPSTFSRCTSPFCSEIGSGLLSPWE